MCGIAAYIGPSQENGKSFAARANKLLQHRGPDDYGIFSTQGVTLVHRRLSIIDLSPLGHQPMVSSCGRYTIVFNGEVYNHRELRKQYLSSHQFRGHSDTETILELYSLLKENMLQHMVGMWALVIWDNNTQTAFVSRDRYGQKPLYMRQQHECWYLSSEVKPLLNPNEAILANETAVAEYLALGNYGHLGSNTFYKDINHFPQGSWATFKTDGTTPKLNNYWHLPQIAEKDKRPFDSTTQKKLHDTIVEGVLSQTLADVPVGITLSGGIDSSIVAGILSAYYDKDIHIFTAQTPGSKYDESKYVDAVIKLNTKNNFIVHRKDLNQLNLKDELEKYINIQEEPFGDPSIMAHGFLMSMAAEAGIKVILNGQGADELFFGYNNMTQAILMRQLKGGKWMAAYNNLKALHLGPKYIARTLLKAAMPATEARMREKSRIGRRSIIKPELLTQVNNNQITLYNYNNPYDVWQESIYGVHLPHLVHYDDRNGMSYSIEGRMPFLDHRIAECVAQIKPDAFVMNGLRKNVLRISCRQYLPDEVYNRTDKIGFFTPLIDALAKDQQWLRNQIGKQSPLLEGHTEMLLQQLNDKTIKVPEALQLWRALSVSIWWRLFNIK